MGGVYRGGENMRVEHLVKDRENGCPLGMKCDSCNWYKPLYQKSERELVEKWDCQVNNLAVLFGESKDRILGVQHAIESARNENVERQDMLLSMVGNNASLPSQ